MASANLTRYALSLGTRDGTTGWRAKSYAETTIQGIILQRGQSFGNQQAGYFANYEHTGFYPDVVAEGDIIKTQGEQYFLTRTIPEQWILDQGQGYFPCDMQLQKNYPETSLTPPTPTLDDPRHRSKVWIDTYLSLGVDWAAMYAFPSYPLQLEFVTAGMEVLYCIDHPHSQPLFHADGNIYAYQEAVPIFVVVLQQFSQDNTQKLLWAAEDALRKVARTASYTASGSKRTVDWIRDKTERYGNQWLVTRELSLNYKRASDYTPSYPTLTWGPSASPTGTYVIPNATNIRYPSDEEIDVWLHPPGFTGSLSQGMGDPPLNIEILCDLDVEPSAKTWKRPQTTTPKTDTVNWEVFWENKHKEGIDEEYHTLTISATGPSLKVRMVRKPQIDLETGVLTLLFREYRASSASSESLQTRLALT